MNQVDKDTLYIGFVFTLIILAVGVPLAWYNYAVTAEAMRNGYEQKRTEGGTIIWAKGEGCKRCPCGK